MGQKVNPTIFRTGPTLFKNWGSVYYADKNYSKYVVEDIKIRNLIFETCKNAQVSEVNMERSSKNMVIGIYVRRPGVIIGKSGADIDNLKKKIKKITDTDISINIYEVKKPDLDSQLIATSIAYQLEKRISFRRAMKRAMQAAMKSGAEGIKVSCSGRLGGAEIARTEWYREGRVPLPTLRSDIDYKTALAHTAYGVIGIKVWLYKGNYHEKKKISKQ